MQIFHYHPETGHFTGLGFADPDPMNEGAWLVPAYATLQPIPDSRAGYLTVFKNGGWVQEPMFPEEGV